MMDRKTYIVNMENLEETFNNFSKSKKYDIRKCQKDVFISDDIDKFNNFHINSRPDRKISREFIEKTYLERQPNCKIYATDNAMAMISWDKDMGYYLLAGRDKTKSDGSASKILWQAMQDLNKLGVKKFNLCGANYPGGICFKNDFGGKLMEQIIPCLIY